MKRTVLSSWLSMLKIKLATLQSSLDTKSAANLITTELCVRAGIPNKRRITFLYTVF